MNLLLSSLILAAPGLFTFDGDLKVKRVSVFPDQAVDYLHVADGDPRTVTHVRFVRSKSNTDQSIARVSETTLEDATPRARVRKFVVGLSAATLQMLFSADMQLTGTPRLTCRRIDSKSCRLLSLSIGPQSFSTENFVRINDLKEEAKLIGAKARELSKRRDSNAQQELMAGLARLKVIQAQVEELSEQ